jgi:hypothetical protein
MGFQFIIKAVPNNLDDMTPMERKNIVKNLNSYVLFIVLSRRLQILNACSPQKQKPNLSNHFPYSKGTNDYPTKTYLKDNNFIYLNRFKGNPIFIFEPTEK